MIKKLRLKCHSLTNSGYALPADVGPNKESLNGHSALESLRPLPPIRHSNMEVSLDPAASANDCRGGRNGPQVASYYDPLGGRTRPLEADGRLTVRLRRPTRLCYSDDDATAGVTTDGGIGEVERGSRFDLSRSLKSASLNDESCRRRIDSTSAAEEEDEEEEEEEEETHMSWTEIMAKKRELEKSLESRAAKEGKGSRAKAKSKRSSFFSPTFKLRDLFNSSSPGGRQKKPRKVKCRTGLTRVPGLCAGQAPSAERSSGSSDDPSPVLFDLRSRGLPAIPMQDCGVHPLGDAAREGYHLCGSWDAGRRNSCTRTSARSSGSSGDFFIDSFNELKNKGWYWGPLSWKEAEDQLKDKPTGSFLVRDSSDDRYILSLTFKSEDKIHHTRIEHYRGQFSFNNQPKSLGAATIVEFIEKAIENCADGSFSYFLRPRGPGVPPTMFRLVRPVSRFTRVHSLQHLCRFVILSKIRRDMIDQLPVPSLVKKYLACTQYYIE